MIKIAIIEDDPTISQMYRMKFEADGFDVRLADNGAIGVELAESFRPDIILLDMQMPEMNGAEALAAIRQQEWGKAIPVIVLTNLGEEEAPAELKDLNVASYIVKANMTPRQVVAAVKTLIDSRASGRPE
ncbi:MAG: response regulator [Candidatus Saccharibacteria bacterium]|nr:response regulator [Candidatus Saccharibacteria bacterium]